MGDDSEVRKSFGPQMNADLVKKEKVNGADVRRLVKKEKVNGRR